MNIAQGLERRLEKLVDGASASVFRGHMHPVDIATRLVRQLEYLAQDTPAGPEVPNAIMVSMNAADLDPHLDRHKLEEELANVATQTARDRGWRMVGAVTITLGTDTSTPRGIIECTGSTQRSLLEPWAQLIAVDGSAVLEVAVNRALIGRDLDCDIRVVNKEVSRHHAVIYTEDGKTFVKDLSSSNGTFVNGVRISAESSPLVAGDAVVLGELSFTFRMVH